ncbi:hypothetical protein VTK26DRAFT_2279 [Humicola hyalothermophila]
MQHMINPVQQQPDENSAFGCNTLHPLPAHMPRHSTQLSTRESSEDCSFGFQRHRAYDSGQRCALEGEAGSRCNRLGFLFRVPRPASLQS